MTDQQRWDALGCVNPVVKTPNLDRLAASGVRFSQATCQAPICVPSRNSMMFGRYPSQTGILTNGCQWTNEADLPGVPLPELIRQAGYQTAGFGKTHWNHSHSKPRPSTRGFETRCIGQSSTSELYEDGASMMGDDDPDGLAAYFAETESYGAGEENALGYLGQRSELPADKHRDGWVTKKCLDFINAGIDPERPLFLYLSFLKPHAGFNVIPEFEDIYSTTSIPPFPLGPSSVNDENHLAYAEQCSSDFMQARRDEWKVMCLKLSDVERKNITLRYWANCSWLDSYFGQILHALEDKGRLANALIVFVSDHGDLMGERDYRFSKYCLYDSSIRVPFFVSGSALPPELRNTVNAEPVELIDVFSVLSSAAGVESVEGAQGINLLAPHRVRSGSFCEFHGSGFSDETTTEAYSWRTSDWKLITYRKNDSWAGELYHLDIDPYEWTSLFSKSEFSDIRKRLLSQLKRHLHAIGKRVEFNDVNGDFR